MYPSATDSSGHSWPSPTSVAECVGTPGVVAYAIWQVFLLRPSVGLYHFTLQSIIMIVTNPSKHQHAVRNHGVGRRM